MYSIEIAEMKLIGATLILCFISSVNCSLQIPQTRICENKLKLNWLWNLRNNNRCLVIIIESVFVPKCLFDEIFYSKFVIKIYELNAIMSRNQYSFEQTNCENFMIFSQDLNEIFGLFRKRTNETTQRFKPFSQLFLVVSDPIEFDQNSLTYIYENGLFVFMVENGLLTVSSEISSDVLSFLALRNVLTDEILDLTISDRKDAIGYFGAYTNHPFLNSKHKKKVFRVSLFKCVPYIIYLPDGTFDGLQYRMLKEITKNWTIEHNHCDFSNKIRVPWNTVLENVNNDISDLAMCSIWMNKPLSHYDTSTYFDLQCGTFLVPKPKLLNAALYIYFSLDPYDWCGSAVSLIVMSFSFTLLVKIGKKLMGNSWKDLVYDNISRSLIDATEVVTSHGVHKSPQQNSMKFLVNSWIIVGFVVGIRYSTGYTSLLNKPISSKPVDTLQQLVESDLVILVNNGDFAKNLIETGSESNIQLAKHVIFDNDTIDSTITVKRNDKQAVFVKVILNNYIGEINNMTDPQYNLRKMRSCILNQYTVVGFKKYSLYTQYFNEKIRLLQEFGIISHWGSSIEGSKNNYMRPFFMNFDNSAEGPKKISIENLIGAFWLLLIGIGIAATVLIIENIYFYWIKSVELEL